MLCIASLSLEATRQESQFCRVKFGAFLDHLEASHKGKFDRIASGHYARLVRGPHEDQPVSLHMTPDVIKDQTYFLASLSQKQLSKIMFPIGSLTKVLLCTQPLLSSDCILQPSLKRLLSPLCFHRGSYIEAFCTHEL